MQARRAVAILLLWSLISSVSFAGKKKRIAVIDVEQVDGGAAKESQTLHSAVKEGSIPAVFMLLSTVNANSYYTVDRFHRSVFHYAAATGALGMLALLLSVGSQATIESEDAAKPCEDYGRRCIEKHLDQLRLRDVEGKSIFEMAEDEEIQQFFEHVQLKQRIAEAGGFIDAPQKPGKNEENCEVCTNLDEGDPNAFESVDLSDPDLGLEKEAEIDKQPCCTCFIL